MSRSETLKGSTKTRHPIWSYCQIPACNGKIAGKYTTNLKKHIKSAHPTIYAQYQGVEETRNENFDGPQLKLSSNGELLTKYPDDHKKQSEFNTSLALLVGSSSALPVSIVENQDFQKIMEIANPRITVPGRWKMNSLIDEQVLRLETIITKEMEHASHVTLCLDIWTKKGLTSSYLGIVVTFFSSLQMKRITATLDVAEMLTVTHKNQDIVSVFKPVMAKFEIKSSQIWRIVTDAGSNMVAAFKGTEELIETEDETFETLLDDLENDGDLTNGDSDTEENMTWH